MRRTYLTAVTVVSTALLLTTTSMLAIGASKAEFGMLKQQDGWKVGTVENGGENYCAMVGNYDKNVVVAFARNPDGLNSMALDLGQDLFKTGQQYDVNLAADGDRPRVMKARASSPRALVVQTGAEEGALYEALSRDSTLSIDSTAASLRVTMPNFAANQKDLVECAGQLKPAAKTAAPKEAALAPIDRELQQLGQARAQIASASAEASSIQKKIDGKTSSFDALEAQLEAEARAESERSRSTLASIGEKEQQLRAEIEKKSGNSLAAIEPAAGGDRLSLDEMDAASPAGKSSGGRKLLATMGAKEAPQVPPSSGMSAREIEASQIELADSDRAARETAKALENKDDAKPVQLAPAQKQEQQAVATADSLKQEIAALEQEKNRAAQEKMAAFDARTQELDQQAQKIETERDSVLAKLASARSSGAISRSHTQSGEAYRPDTSAKETTQEKASKTATAANTTKAATPADASMALSADGETGTDVTAAVKPAPAPAMPAAKVAEVQSSGITPPAAPVAPEQTRITSADIKWDEPVAVVGNADTGADMRRLRAGVVASQAKLAEVQNVKASETAALTRDLAATQDEFKSRLAVLENERNALRQKVDNVTAENNRLKQTAGQGSAVDRAEIARLEKQLSDMEAQRQSEVARAAEAQKALEAARSQMAELRQSREAEQTRLSQLQQRLESERAQLSADKGAAVRSASVEIEKERADLNALKGQLDKKQAELQQEESRLKEEASSAKTAALTPTDADGKPISPGAAILGASQRLVETERAELETLRGRIGALESDLETARDETAAAKAALAAAPAPVAAAVTPAEKAEMGRLKTENASLRDRLASFLSRDAKRDREKSMPVASVETAVGLNATEPAAGDSTRDNSPGNDKRMPAVPAGKVMAEVVPPVAPEAELATISVTDAVKGAAPSDAEMEIANMAPITASVPRETAVASASARDVEKQDDGVFSIFGRALGYGAATKNKGKAGGDDVVVAAAAPAPATPAKAVIRVTRPEPAAAPVPAPAPVTAQGGNGISADEANRAAAFLDNIMAFHRPGGATAQDQAKLAAIASAPETVEAPAKTVMAAAAPPPAVPPVAPAAVVEEAAPAPVMAAAPAAPVVTAAVSPVAEKLMAVEPAAGDSVSGVPSAPVRPSYMSQGVSRPVTAAVAAAAPAPVEKPVNEMPTAATLGGIEPAAGSLIAAPVRAAEVQTPAAPVAKAQPASAPVIALDALLQGAGVNNARIGGGNNGVYQWNAGALNGMYETMPSIGRHAEQAAGYLARYREDCPGQLDVQQGQPQKTAGGSVSTAVISCAAAGNTYTTSLVFLDTPAGFQTVMHAGQPRNAAEVRRIGDMIGAALQPVSGIRVTSSAPAVVPASYAAQPAPAQAAPVQRRFRIQIDAPAQPPQDYDLPTTIIE